MPFIRLSGKKISFPLRRKGIFKNLKVDLATLVLLLLAVLYGGTAFKMQTPLPFAPIASGSMEPAISQGDLALVKRVGASEIQEGDVIVFTIPPETRPAGYPAIRLAHRVVRVEKDPAAGLVFWTKGDALEVMDPFGTPARLVHGKVVYAVPVLGHAWLFFQSKPGLIFAGLVVILLVLYRVEKPLRTWANAIVAGRITDPELLAKIDEMEEARTIEREERHGEREELRQFRVMAADFAEQIQAHLGAVRSIGTAAEELTQAVRESQSSGRKRKKKTRKRRQ